MGACVLLLHQLSDGASHYDWLIEPDEPADALLIAFRIHDRIDLSVVPAFEAERMADHRRVYLTYEGPLSRNRGEVRRLAAGRLSVRDSSDQTLYASGQLAGRAVSFSGRAATDGRWTFAMEAACHG